MRPRRHLRSARLAAAEPWRALPTPVRRPGHVPLCRRRRLRALLVRRLPRRRGGPADADGVGAGRSWSRTLRRRDARSRWRVWSRRRVPGRRDATPGAGGVDIASSGRPVPPPASVTADEGAAAYRAWTSSTTASTPTTNCSTRPSRAAWPTCGCSSTMARTAGALPGRRRAVVRDPLRTRRDHHRPPTPRVPAAARLETLEVLAARRRRRVDDWLDAEPGKILHEWRTSEMVAAGELPVLAVLRHDRRDAALARAARGDVRLDRRSRSRRPAWPNALAALEWIDRWGDVDGDGFVEYGRRRPAGSTTRAGRIRATRSGTGDGVGPSRRSPSPRCRATSTTRSGGWRRSPDPRRVALAARLEARRGGTAGAGSKRRSGSGRATTRWRSTARSGRPTRSGRMPGHCLWSGIVDAGARRRRSRAAPGPGAVLAAGGSGPTRRPAGVQPDRLSHRHRSGRMTPRSPRPG